MTQYEQENDLGGGGGEVDAETMREAWETREERGDGVTAEDVEREREEQADQTEAEPWAKALPADEPDGETA